MEIFLVRHGESVWNRQHRIQGRKDPGLSENGRRQALAVAKHLKKEGIEVVYTSRLKRCAQTARIVAKAVGVKMVFQPDIEEIILGDWQGKTVEEVRNKYPKIYKAWLKAPSTARIPGWEGISRFTRRVDRAFKEILNEDCAQSVCVVTHWGVIAAHLSNTLHADFDSIFKTVRIDNCGINKISYKNGKAVIQCINDTRHLS
jgi:broad specificity phosphatase PhoE